MKDPNLLIEKRRQEILNAFFKLYETHVFGDIHVKTISVRRSTITSKTWMRSFCLRISRNMFSGLKTSARSGSAAPR